jgi:Subtilase family
MNRCYYFLCLFLLFLGSQRQVLAQKINPNYVDGAVYLKVRALDKSAINKITTETDIKTELPFLSRFTARFTVLQARQPFYFSTNSNLKRVYRLTLENPALVEKFIDGLGKDIAVEYVEKVPLMKISVVPNDPFISTQYSLSTIKAYEAWNVSQGNSTIKIAICDNAIQTNHPDLQANMLPGYDVADGDSDPNPPSADFAHGTHVAGTAGAVTNNGIGIASMGFNNIKLVPVKSSTNTSGGILITHPYEGVVWAAQNNRANIINTSWGGGGYSATEQAIADDVYSRGMIWVAAAGNDASSTGMYPAAYNNVLSVASTTSTDARSSFSNYGTTIDFCAPGSGIYSTVPFDLYDTYNGTSMASPLAASVLGYIWSVNPTLTNTQLIALIKNTCDNIDAQNPAFVGLLGSGRINVLRAVQQACPNPPVVSIMPSTSAVICEGTTLSLTATTLPNGTYQWTKDKLLIGTNANTLTVAETGVYGLTFLGSNGCPSVATSVTVTVIPSVLSVSTNKPAALCGPNDQVTLSIGPMVGASVVWQKDGNPVANIGSDYVVNQPGNYAVTVSSSIAGCAVTSDVLSITTVLLDPKITISGSTNLCPSQTVRLTTVAGSDLTYRWQRGTGFVGTNSNGLTVNTSGIYFVSISKGLCTFVSSSVVVSVLPTVMSISATRPATFCPGDSTILQATDVPGLGYLWKRNGSTLNSSSSSSLLVRVGGQYTAEAAFSSCSVVSAPYQINVPDFSPVISSANQLLACTGTTVSFSVSSAPLATYQWFKNGSLISGATSTAYSTTQTGVFQAKATLSTCLIPSNTVSVQFFDTQTTLPTVQPVAVCGLDPATPTGSFLATPVTCPASVTINPTYMGTTVGYDGNLKSDNDPSVVVSGLTLLSRMEVSISWEKKSGGIYTSCSAANGTGGPYNAELQFRLQSPQGTIITLVPRGQYGGNYAGVVTTIFRDGATTIATGSQPTSGTFAANQSLSALYAENPNGTWTLLPNDNGSLDPLCVSGFSLRLITIGTNQAPAVSWWDAPTEGIQVGSGTSFSFVTPGSLSAVYAQAICEGQCPSNRVSASTTNAAGNIAMQSSQTGNWTDPSTWSCGRVPASSDVVYINPGHIVTVNSGLQSAKRVIYRGGKLQFLSGSRLQLSF